MAKNPKVVSMQPMKRFKKIPVYVVEEHNDALQFIYSAIGGKKLPLEGTTLLHLDAHPDMLIDRKLRGEDARSGRKLLSLLQIENWIVPAAAAGHIDRVVWLRPPWAKQLSDGTRDFRVGDDTKTGLLRVDSKEPYYLSDALYSKDLINTRNLNLTVAELSENTSGNQKGIGPTKNFVDSLKITQPYVLDIDLDFFSTGNPFLLLYKNIDLYNRLEPIFNFELPDLITTENIDGVVERRKNQIDELEALFEHLEEHNSLDTYIGEKTDLFYKVYDLANVILEEAKRLDETADWWAVYAAGCTRDQGGLPFHISSDDEITQLIKDSLALMLRHLPPPVVITVSRSTDDGYCPSHQVDKIQNLVLETLKDLFDTDSPHLHYLSVNTL